MAQTDFIPRTLKLVFLDATKRFPFKDNTFEYIFSEEMIEHIDFSKGIFMLNECYRVLKPGGKIRIATPDFARMISFYSHDKSEVMKEHLNIQRKLHWPNIADSYPNQGIFLINWGCKASGHKFIYDYETLSKAIGDAGFINIKRCNIRESEDENLSNLEAHDINYAASPLVKQFREKWEEEFKGWRLIVQGEKPI